MTKEKNAREHKCTVLKEQKSNLNKNQFDNGSGFLLIRCLIAFNYFYFVVIMRRDAVL